MLLESEILFFMKTESFAMQWKPILGLIQATKPPSSVSQLLFKADNQAKKLRKNQTTQTKGRNSVFLCSKLPYETVLMAVWSIENQSFSPWFVQSSYPHVFVQFSTLKINQLLIREVLLLESTQKWVFLAAKSHAIDY